MSERAREIAPRVTLNRREITAFAGAALALPWRMLAAQDTPSGPAVWLDMDQAALDAAYDQRVYAPNMDAVQAQQAAMNDAAKSRLERPTRYRYGSATIEGIDVYDCGVSGAPIFAFLHGGTWRFGTAADYAFIAEPYVRAGAHVAIVDFSPVDAAPGGLTEIVGQVRRAIAWLYQNAAQIDADAARLYVAGHSSGGHLAGAVLTTDWRADFDMPPDVVRAGMCISGMFDLEPVRLSWRNEYLALDAAAVDALSPQRHLEHLNVPIIVAYGTHETPEFQRQSRDFAHAVREARKPVELLVGESLNHFEIRGTLANPYGLTGYAALQQMGFV
jgi:arylformamidase